MIQGRRCSLVFFTSEHIFLELSSVGYQKCVTVLVLSLSFCGVQEKQFNL